MVRTVTFTTVESVVELPSEPSPPLLCEPLSWGRRPSRLLNGAGVPVTRLRQVDVPAPHAAEPEFQPSGVTGRHWASI